jgi:2-dehydro-3-deoxyphosphogluconate aldolase/(4S)-4-hydroxy-2-oxoglutarate aldolase
LTRIADETLARIAELRVVPVVVLDEPEQALPLASALVAGGLPIAEITLRTPTGLEAIRRVAAAGEVLVGAGTVLTGAQVDDCVAAGADFVVSPGTSREVVERSWERGVLVLPGVVTPSDVMTALSLGVTTMKYFPAATSGGVRGIQALAAPFREVRFVPTGGIDTSNAADYLALPSVIAVGGSWMVPRDRINAGAFDDVAGLAAGAARIGRSTEEAPWPR